MSAARKLAALLLPAIEACPGRLIVTLAGESGAGKSACAAALRDALANRGIRSAILQLDDYFVYPPKSNDRERRKDIGRVGLSEVRLGLLDDHLRGVMEGKTQVTKPLVDYEADSIGEEVMDLEGVEVVLVDGTYTTVLRNVHRRVFIDRCYTDTREARTLRAREAQDDYLERILEIEHRIIASHRDRADIVITRDYDVMEIESTRR